MCRRGKEKVEGGGVIILCILFALPAAGRRMECRTSCGPMEQLTRPGRPVLWNTELDFCTAPSHLNPRDEAVESCGTRASSVCSILGSGISNEGSSSAQPSPAQLWYIIRRSAGP